MEGDNTELGNLTKRQAGKRPARAEGTRAGGDTWKEGSLGWNRPDALRVEWRQNGSDDTDVTRARCSLRRIRVNVDVESLTAIIIRGLANNV